MIGVKSPGTKSHKLFKSSQHNYSSLLRLYITKCIKHFMIHKRRKLTRCSITQSSESVQQSIYGFFTYTSLQKVLKLILPPNHRHFLSQSSAIPTILRYTFDRIPNISDGYCSSVQRSIPLFS